MPKTATLSLSQKLLIITLCWSTTGLAQESESKRYIHEYNPVDQELFDTIVAMDKKYFDAYNSCDMETQAALYSEDLEFFHDRGGLSTSKEDLLNAIEENICGRVTRSLVPGSIEVYPIANYGAVEMGYHKFHNKEEPNAVPTPARFVMLWKKEADRWVITKVISLH